jgi:hypothetical protein
MKNQQQQQQVSETHVGAAANPRVVANPDMEALVKARLKTAIEMALAVKLRRNVSADDVIYECAVAGIINGAAIEIIRTLRLEPGYVNIQRPGSHTITTATNAGSPVSAAIQLFTESVVDTLKQPDPMRPWAWLGGAGDALERKLDERESTAVRKKALVIGRYIEAQWKKVPTPKVLTELRGLINPQVTVATNLSMLNRYIDKQWNIRPTSSQLAKLADLLQ